MQQNVRLIAISSRTNCTIRATVWSVSDLQPYPDNIKTSQAAVLANNLIFREVVVAQATTSTEEELWVEDTLLVVVVLVT